MTFLPSLDDTLPFYLSAPSACAYLQGQTEQKLFTHVPDHPVQAAVVTSLLIASGFRRSHQILYRPVCKKCAACIPIRIPVERFVPTKTQQKILRRTAHLTFDMIPSRADASLYELFLAYEQARHEDSDMAHMTQSDLDLMLRDGTNTAQLYLLKNALEPTAYGAMLVDALTDGYSANYSFYRPDRPHDSLGTVLILRLIEWAHAKKQPYVYLGYWIEDARQMGYKKGFAGAEILSEEGWRPLRPAKP